MESLIYRLRKRAEIRRQIATRKSVQEGKPDRIAELLEEAAARIEQLEAQKPAWKSCGDFGQTPLAPKLEIPTAKPMWWPQSEHLLC